MKKAVGIGSIFFLVIMVALTLSACQSKAYTARYFSDENGTIEGVYIQTLYSGTETQPVTAVPNEGYHFVKWSDNGSTNPTRTDCSSKDVYAVALFAKNNYSVKYETDGNGAIYCESDQTVAYEEDSLEVVAVPNEGYRFVKWSDGSTKPSRKETKVTTDLSFIAIFEKIVHTYTYIYNNATGNTAQDRIDIKYETLEQTTFVVPEKEYFTFQGWYLDKDYTIPVSDETGRLLIGHDLFQSESRNLYAKWNVNEQVEFKILLVYVSEIQATLETTDGTFVTVDYKLSELERKVCKAITQQVRKYINELLDGLINFTVDEYFTTKVLGKENIHHGEYITGDGKDGKWYSVHARNIPEIKDKIKDYDSVIVTNSMNDYDHRLYFAAGSGGYKSAELHFESLVGQTIANGDTIEALLDMNYRQWGSLVSSYLHEFIHTVEQGLSVYEFHKALAECRKQGITDDYVMYKQYLLNQVVINGEKVGIPYPVWKHEVYTMTYKANLGTYGEMGYVEGSSLWNGMPQRVAKGYNGLPVIAIPLTGHEFIGWSDGVMTETRTDKNIQSNFIVTALFKPKLYQVHYIAGEGGKISGKTTQEVIFMEERTETVIAIPDEGYIFVEWSDGNRNAERYDYIDILHMEIKVTAFFKKIGE